MLAFRESMEHSKLRHLIVDRCAWEGSATALMTEVTVRDAMLPGFGLELSLALLKRVETAVAPVQEQICPARAQSGRNNEHMCSCGTFKTLTSQSCTYASSGLHACNYCALRFDHWQQAAEGSPKLAPKTEAPYHKSFCANYHEHKDGVICNNSESLSGID